MRMICQPGIPPGTTRWVVTGPDTGWLLSVPGAGTSVAKAGAPSVSMLAARAPRTAARRRMRFMVTS